MAAAVNCACGVALPDGKDLYCGDGCKRRAWTERRKLRRRVANGYQRCNACERVGGRHWEWCERMEAI